MSKGSSGSDRLNDWNGFYEEFQKESPRAAVMIGAAFLDGWLHKLLTNYLIDDSAVEKLLGGDEGGDRPLSTFGAKTLAAFCLGLISREEYDDLNLIRKVRNKLAHHLHGVNFKDEQIVGWCGALKIPAKTVGHSPHFPRTPESWFLGAVSMLASGLALKSKQITHREIRKPVEFVRLQSKASDPTPESTA